VGEFAPAARHAEFFGLWTLSTRAAAIVGPVTYGVVTLITDGNHRLAILSTAMFFALGLALLWRVDLGRGVAVARAG
jgi:UMF1 family MFS transporter